MPIEPTQQERALDSPGEHVRRVVDPRTGAASMLAPEAGDKAYQGTIDLAERLPGHPEPLASAARLALTDPRADSRPLPGSRPSW